MLKEEDIQAIRSSVSMPDLVRAYGFEISRGGYIRCPFHGTDRHPSMKIYPGQRGYYCYTCNSGGDVIDFCKRYEGVTFEQAVRRIAEMFGIPISEGADRKDHRKVADERRRQREAETEIQRLEKQYILVLSDQIRLCEQWIEMGTAPLGPLWTALHNQKERLTLEWEKYTSKGEKG